MRDDFLTSEECHILFECLRSKIFSRDLLQFFRRCKKAENFLDHSDKRVFYLEVCKDQTWKVQSEFTANIESLKGTLRLKGKRTLLMEYADEKIITSTLFSLRQIQSTFFGCEGEKNVDKIMTRGVDYTKLFCQAKSCRHRAFGKKKNSQFNFTNKAVRLKLDQYLPKHVRHLSNPFAKKASHL
jgi:hypothetical protein